MASSPTSEKAARLLATLRRLFQYDRRDLDFGIYRVLNQRRDDIERFLTEELLPEIQEAFSAQKANGDVSASALADGVCADLERFFSRYYDEGDFLPLRRYRADTYAVPYEGEEVLLHWANRDQYYVKGSASLSGLATTLPDRRRVRLEVVASHELAGGIKPAPGEERRFVLAPDPIEVSDNELLIRFAYARVERGVSQADLNAESLEAVLADDAAGDWRISLGADGGPLATAIARFTAKNTQDYFIHRDLGGFLRRELDFFIKNEQLHVDEIDNAPTEHIERALARIRVFRRVASQVIDFLHQVEEFQKRIWLKRNCVLETSWLVTLDRVPEELHAAIAANDAQRRAWVDLLAIDRIERAIEGPGYSEPLEPGFLVRFPHLVVDTRHFSAEFTDRLLQGIGDVDASTTGVIVCGENFQTLSLLERRYRGEVSCIYLDPPYNTGDDGFLYKDAYQHSSWLSLMSDRLQVAREYLRTTGVLLVSIDDNEFPRFKLLVDQIFDAANILATLVWNKHHSQQQGLFKEYHEYVLAVARTRAALSSIEGGSGEIVAGAMKRISRANPASDFTFPAGVACEAADGTEFTGTWGDSETVELVSGRFRVDGGRLAEECTLRAGWTQARQMSQYFSGADVVDTRGQRVLDFYFNSRGKLKVRKERRVVTPSTILEEYGTQAVASNSLRGVFGRVAFDRPKPVPMLKDFVSWFGPGEDDCILDFFAGSGTIAHAALDHARDQGMVGRYLLVENGEHFESVLRPRVIKAIHAGEWADGIPKERRGVSSLVQSLRIESYEDALDSIELDRTEAQEDLLRSSAEFRKSYLLRYLLDHEGRRPMLDRGLFARPFEAQTQATVNGERTSSAVDLVATFSWLLGLRVDGLVVRDGVKIVRGADPDGKRVLVLWRTLEDMPNDRMNAWFASLDDDVRGPSPDVVYVNGDATLGMVRPDAETWEVRLLEAEFERLMFLVADEQRAE